MLRVEALRWPDLTRSASTRSIPGALCALGDLCVRSVSAPSASAGPDPAGTGH